MNAFSGSLADQIARDGAVSAEELLALRKDDWTDGALDQAEADALFAINDRLTSRDPAWSAFFVDAMCAFLIEQATPRGYVGDAAGDWLIAHIASDGTVDGTTELELIDRLFERATSVPARLKTVALATIEQCVLTGNGPTRNGGRLDPGAITDAEVALLRRFIFAPAGDGPASVGKDEAEMLFRLKDAMLGADNAPEWKRLFAQGVGNYLRGLAGDAPPSAERAAELDAFMNRPSGGIGGMLRRMNAGSDDFRSGFKWMCDALTGSDEPARNHDAEAEAAAAITPAEQSWLDQHVKADGQIDAYEQALIAFLKED